MRELSGHRAVLVNGKPCLDGLVQIDADDEGLLLGRAAFETLRTYSRQLFALDEHIERLVASASVLGIPLPSLDQIMEEAIGVADAIEGEAVVRITLTAGGVRIVRGAGLPPQPTALQCVTRHFVPPDWLDGTVKHTSRAFSRMAVLDAGVDEVLWVDEQGMILEGTRSNVFAVRGGVFQTPPADGRFLSGVTRSYLIEAAAEAGIPVDLTALPMGERYDELYVSSTLKEMTAVESLDGVATAGAGPIGAAVLEAFRSLVLDALI